MEFSNREGLHAYDFRLKAAHRRHGVSALVRARNEAQKIEHCLRSILPVFDEVVVVDNASDDGMMDVVRQLKEEHAEAHKIHTYSYPFRLARFGPEHDDTPEDSIHSAVYFSNWCLSHCSRQYVCKWDGDMVLRYESRQAFVEFLREVKERRRRCWTLLGQTVYRDRDGNFFLSVDEVNKDVELIPNSDFCRFVKKQHWEALSWPSSYRLKDYAAICFYELKFVDEDEFAHWSTRHWPSLRKQREWANFCAIRDGSAASGRLKSLSRDFLERETSQAQGADLQNSAAQRVLEVVLPRPVRRKIRRLRRRAELRRSERQFLEAVRPSDVFLIGHPKSGNTWLAYMLSVMLFGETSGRISLENVGSYVPYVHGEDERIADHAQLPDPRIFRNEYPKFERLYPRVIYLVRDPRAVMVSFWHMYRVMFDDSRTSLSSFLDQYLSQSGCFTQWNVGLPRWDRQVQKWVRRSVERDDVLLLRYEDLVFDRRAALLELCRFLSIPARADRVDLAVERGSFVSMQALEAEHGAEAYKGKARGQGRFVRAGKVDGWTTEMDEPQIRVIEREFSSAMRQVGYRAWPGQEAITRQST